MLFSGFFSFSGKLFLTQLLLLLCVPQCIDTMTDPAISKACRARSFWQTKWLPENKIYKDYLSMVIRQQMKITNYLANLSPTGWSTGFSKKNLPNSSFLLALLILCFKISSSLCPKFVLKFFSLKSLADTFCSNAMKMAVINNTLKNKEFILFVFRLKIKIIFYDF